MVGAVAAASLAEWIQSPAANVYPSSSSFLTAEMRCLSMVLMVLISQLQSIQRRPADDHILARGHAFKADRVDDGAELQAELRWWQRVCPLPFAPSGITVAKLPQGRLRVWIRAQSYPQEMRHVFPLIDGAGRDR